jgi:hypothetical protein
MRMKKTINLGTDNVIAEFQVMKMANGKQGILITIEDHHPLTIRNTTTLYLPVEKARRFVSALSEMIEMTGNLSDEDSLAGKMVRARADIPNYHALSGHTGHIPAGAIGAIEKSGYHKNLIVWFSDVGWCEYDPTLFETVSEDVRDTNQRTQDEEPG